LAFKRKITTPKKIDADNQINCFPLLPSKREITHGSEVAEYTLATPITAITKSRSNANISIRDLVSIQ
jgi:hypothetical protein